MERLLKIGFHEAGEWKICGEEISPDFRDLKKNVNILYAFISNGEVLYSALTDYLEDFSPSRHATWHRKPLCYIAQKEDL